MSVKPVNQDYIDSISDVMQFIDRNLDADLSLERLAGIALFSKYHFHRVFKGAVGESLNAYVIRRRLERAAILLKRNPQRTVTQVALQTGFNSPEHFSRSFRDKFGITASQFRDSDPADPDSPKNRKIYQAVSEHSFYHVYEQSREMEPVEFEVTVREQPGYHVALISDTFGEDGMPLVRAWEELMGWAGEKDLVQPDSVRFAMSRDDIEITPAEQYRLEFCISVPPGTPTCGRIRPGEICGGSYALIPVQGDIHRVAQAWDYLYRDWLPCSGFRPVDEPAVEIFRKGPEQIGWEQFDLEVGIPITRHC